MRGSKLFNPPAISTLLFLTLRKTIDRMNGRSSCRYTLWTNDCHPPSSNLTLNNKMQNVIIHRLISCLLLTVQYCTNKCF